MTKAKYHIHVAIYLVLEEYIQAMSNLQIELAPSSSKDNSPLLYFFNLLYAHILNSHVSDPNKQLNRTPMDEAEKQRQRDRRRQKEAGKKRKYENKQEQRAEIERQLELGLIKERVSKFCLVFKSKCLNFWI